MVRKLGAVLSCKGSAADQTDSQVDASRRKFAKPELAYGLAMGGQTDFQVGSQVHASRKETSKTCVDLRVRLARALRIV